MPVAAASSDSTPASDPSIPSDFALSRPVCGALIALGFFLACALYAFLYYQRGFYSISADESARTIMANQWRAAKGLQLHTWLPLPQIIVGLGLDLHPDFFRVPRLLSGMFGLLTWAAMVWLAHELFRNRTATAFTAILAALFPHRVILSNVPLSEIYVACFDIAAFAALARYLRLPRNALLWFAAACLVLGNLTRYESWMFSGTFLLVLFLLGFRPEYRTSRRLVVLLAVLLAVFPVIWLHAWYKERGSIFYFSKIIAAEHRYLFGDSAWQAFKQSALPQFLSENLVTFNLLGLAALPILWARERLTRWWLLFAGVPFLFMALLTAFGGALPSHNCWRLGTLWCLMLVPFTAYFMALVHADCHRRVARRGFAATASLLAFGGLAALFLWQDSERTRTSPFTREERSLGETVGALLRANDPTGRGVVLADTSHWGFLNISVVSGLPGRFIDNSGMDARRQIPSRLTGNVASDNKFMRERNVHFVIVRKPELRKIVAGNPALQSMRDLGGWQLLRFFPDRAVSTTSTLTAEPKAGVYQPNSPLRFMAPSRMPESMQKLWDGAVPNLVYLVHTGWGNAVFDLHLFEDLLVPAKGWPQKHYFNNRRLDADRWRWRAETDGWHFELDQQELINFRLEGRVWAEADAVRVEGRITNRGDVDWVGGGALMCLRTRNAPSFVDTIYRNVFLFPADGAPRVSVRTLLGVDYDRKKPGSQFFFIGTNRPNQPRYEPHVLKLDREGRRRIEFSADPCSSLSGNREPLMNCIHANLALDVPKGQTGRFSATILFTGREPSTTAPATPMERLPPEAIAARAAATGSFSFGVRPRLMPQLGRRETQRP
jgi:hypothetical protein